MHALGITNPILRAVLAAALVAALPACQSRSVAMEHEESAESAAAAPPRQTTVREVLGKQLSSGQVVAVSGDCAPAGSRDDVGLPPAGGEPWLLRADGIAVYVMGAAPATCATGSDSVTIVARVAEDTIPGTGSIPPAPRRYLVRLDR